MNAFGSRIVAFFAAVAVAYTFGTLSYSQVNLASLVELGMPVDMGVRLQTAWHDLTSMYDLYLPLMAVTLALAFMIARVVMIWLPLRMLGFILAGFCGVWVLDALLGAVLTGGTHPLVVTRFTGGWLTQCLAGALGGFAYAWVRGLTGEPQAAQAEASVNA